MHETTIDHARRTIRPTTPQGDAWFGLASGTNGTAAAMRRALIEPAGYTWRTHDGDHARGLHLAGGETTPESWISPWDGPRSSPAAWSSL